MRYRELGRTGLQVSEIALGCEGFEKKPEEFTRELLTFAMEQGVNFMDFYSPNPEFRSQLGRILAGKWGQFILQAHLCTVWQGGQYKATRNLAEVKASFADLLSRLGTDRVDIGMFHYVDTLANWEIIRTGGILEYALQQKAAGHIGHLGISSHNPAVALEVVKSGLIDVLMFSVNPCYDLLPAAENCETLWAESSYEKPLLNMNPLREELYETCQRMDVGITVMKAFGGGDLLSQYSPAGMALTANQCIHYALTRPAVASVMSGVQTMEDLKTSLAYETAADEERDYAAAFAAFPKIRWEGHCMYCGHCAPCPEGIDIASVTKFLNLAKAQGQVPETVREHYAALPHRADACVQCGACEKRCPFQVPIRENMKQAAELFGRQD